MDKVDPLPFVGCVLGLQWECGGKGVRIGWFWGGLYRSEVGSKGVS